MEDFDWKYSDLDIIDRLEIKQLAPEAFGATSRNPRCPSKSLGTCRRSQWPKP
jgi:hypothetical protein